MGTDREILEQLIAAQPKPDCAELTPFAIKDASLADGLVRLEFAPQPAFRNHFGNIQGGFAVAMLDAVISMAAFAKLRLWLPTVEIKTSFLEPLPIAVCIGEGRVIKSGKSLAFVEGCLLTGDGRPGVTATATALVPSTRS